MKHTEHLKMARAMRAQLTQLVQKRASDPVEESTARQIVSCIRALYGLEILGVAAIDATMTEVARHLEQIPQDVIERYPQLGSCIKLCGEMLPHLERTQHFTSVSEKAASAKEENSSRVIVRIGTHSKDNFYTGLSGNVLEGGVFIAAQAPMPMGTQVQLRVEIEDQNPIEVEGRVAWVSDEAHPSERGVGIRFCTLSRDDEITILRCLGHKEPLLAIA